MSHGSGWHWLAGDDVGGLDRDEVALLPSYDHDAVGPRLADAQHIGHRGAAGGTCLAAHQASYDDALSDHVGAEEGRVPVSTLGHLVAAHGGILGWPSVRTGPNP